MKIESIIIRRKISKGMNIYDYEINKIKIAGANNNKNKIGNK